MKRNSQVYFDNILITVVFFSFLLLFNSCVTNSYYVSPLYGGSTPYHSIPLHSDLNISSLYTNLTFTNGRANENGHDRVFSVAANLYNAHHFGLFNAWYGLGATLGSYTVYRFENITSPYNNITFDTALINRLAGSKSFGSTNLGAGMSFVIPLAYGSEWRLFGVNASLQNEFGNYLQFRNTLNKDSVSGVVKNNILGTIGFSTEIVGKMYEKVEFGFLFQQSYLLGKDYSNLNLSDTIHYYPTIRFNYFTMNTHFSYDRYSIFATLNVGFRTRMNNGQIGFNYKILDYKNNKPFVKQKIKF